MKGILQQFDADAQGGYDVAFAEIQSRSRSRGRDGSTGAKSERFDRSPAISPQVLNNPKVESVAVLPPLQNQRSIGPLAGGAQTLDPRTKQFNESFQTEKRNAPGLQISAALAESQNKALQHDMEQRFENQDRMINYLMQQIQSQESTASNSLRRANELSEKDRESAQKRVVDLSIKFDDASIKLADLSTKVQLM